MVPIISAAMLPSAGLAFEGCLGSDVTVCLSQIAPQITQSEYDAALRSVSEFDQPDINGRMKTKGIVTILYKSKFADDSNDLRMISMDIARDHRVTELSISLYRSPILASTDQDTHMFEVAQFALGDRNNCSETSDRHAFYLFFHNKIRPTIRKDPTEFQVTATEASAYDYLHSAWQKICGSKMQYVSGSGTSTTTIDENNPSGEFGGPSLDFK
ncbi:MAG TPA: hypothetical protein VF886_18055 [Roseiarcus sp.]